MYNKFSLSPNIIEKSSWNRKENGQQQDGKLGDKHRILTLTNHTLFLEKWAVMKRPARLSTSTMSVSTTAAA